MRYLLLLLLTLSIVNADLIKKETLACPSVMQLQKVPSEVKDDYMKLSMYAIANDCIIVGRRDNVEAIGYDSLNSKEIFQQIIYKKTGVHLYILKSAIQIEQDGKKSSYRF